MDTTHKNAVIINVVAVDRPGIVAAISKAVAAADGNIDACSQTVVGQYFTLIMIASFPEPADTDKLKGDIAAHDDDLSVLVLDYHPATANTPGGGDLPPVNGENFIFTAIGSDREGITHKFSSLMGDRGINITDLYGTRKGGNFILIGKICVPTGWDLEMLKAELDSAASEIGHTVRLQHEDIFVATSQIRPPYAAVLSQMTDSDN